MGTILLVKLEASRLELIMVSEGLLKIEILFFSLTGNLDVQLDQVFKNYVWGLRVSPVGGGSGMADHCCIYALRTIVSY